MNNKFKDMIESTVRYLHKPASDMHPRDIYFSQLVKDENLDENEAAKLASLLQQNGVLFV